MKHKNEANVKGSLFPVFCFFFTLLQKKVIMIEIHFLNSFTSKLTLDEVITTSLKARVPWSVVSGQQYWVVKKKQNHLTSFLSKVKFLYLI